MVKKSARGLAHSKTWRPRLRPRFSRSVLDRCSPSAFAARHSAASARRRLPLFPHRPMAAEKFPKLFWPASPAVSALRSVRMISRKKLNINSMKTNLIPAQPASAFGAPPSGDPGLVNAELRTASRRCYPALKFALLSLLAALCFAAPRAHASGGTVIGWGHNFYGQVNIPADLSGVTNIAAGRFHSLALKSEGTVVGWGYNLYGQVNIPAELSGVTAIAAGDFHSLALKLPNRPPVARCQNVTVSAGADCAATVTPAQVNDGSSDPDTGDAINLSLDTTGPFGLGSHT